MSRVGSTWSPAEIPDLAGKRFLVTGVTSGLGASVAEELAARGAEVVLAARSADKLKATAAGIRARTPDARLQQLRVDLADLSSVRRAATEAEVFGPIDVLINNAGVMTPPYTRTVDGYELQLATNFLGPFALTGLLLPQVVASGAGRVVNTASQAHRFTRKAPLGDPRVQVGRYSKWRSYAQSKLADMMFTYELDRRLRDSGQPVRALAAHPGFAATGLMTSGRYLGKEPVGPASRILVSAFGALGQSAHMGALPTLMAATADLPGGTYVGPDGFAQLRGNPRVVNSSRASRNPQTQRRLWELSQEATGVKFL